MNRIVVESSSTTKTTSRACRGGWELSTSNHDDDAVNVFKIDNNNTNHSNNVTDDDDSGGSDEVSVLSNSDDEDEDDNNNHHHQLRDKQHDRPRNIWIMDQNTIHKNVVNGLNNHSKHSIETANTSKSTASSISCPTKPQRTISRYYGSTANSSELNHRYPSIITSTSNSSTSTCKRTNTNTIVSSQCNNMMIMSSSLDVSKHSLSPTKPCQTRSETMDDNSQEERVEQTTPQQIKQHQFKSLRREASIRRITTITTPIENQRRPSLMSSVSYNCHNSSKRHLDISKHNAFEDACLDGSKHTINSTRTSPNKPKRYNSGEISILDDNDNDGVPQQKQFNPLSTSCHNHPKMIIIHPLLILNNDSMMKTDDNDDSDDDDDDVASFLNHIDNNQNQDNSNDDANDDKEEEEYTNSNRLLRHSIRTSTMTKRRMSIMRDEKCYNSNHISCSLSQVNMLSSSFSQVNMLSSSFSQVNMLSSASITSFAGCDD